MQNKIDNLLGQFHQKWVNGEHTALEKELTNMLSEHHNLMCQLYQILGALDAPANVLDNVSAAMHGETLPHGELLPFVVDVPKQPALQSAPVVPEGWR